MSYSGRLVERIAQVTLLYSRIVDMKTDLVIDGYEKNKSDIFELEVARRKAGELWCELCIEWFALKTPQNRQEQIVMKSIADEAREIFGS